MKKIATGLFLAIGMAVIALPASADTYTLDFQNGTGNVGGVEIFPYTFNVTDNDTHLQDLGVSLMCIDFDREIIAGETWQANLIPAAGDVDTRALAILYSEIINPNTTNSSTPDISDIQFAAWAILASPSDLPNNPLTYNGTNGNANPGFDSEAYALEQAALTEAADPNSGFDYSGYGYFDPTDPTSPQRFMIYTPPGSNIVVPHTSPVPEPSSLALLGTGVLGLASIARRRFKA